MGGKGREKEQALNIKNANSPFAIAKRLCNA
jgi:hypothetical protein